MDQVPSSARDMSVGCLIRPEPPSNFTFAALGALNSKVTLRSDSMRGYCAPGRLLEGTMGSARSGARIAIRPVRMVKRIIFGCVSRGILKSLTMSQIGRAHV